MVKKVNLLSKIIYVMAQYNYAGGLKGHCLRRLIHIGMAIIPVLYYWHGTTVANFLLMPTKELIGIIILIIFILEMVRLYYGIVAVGQRDYEANQISAFAWGSFGIAATLLFAPEYGHQQAAFGLPLIWSLALGDPVLGEARRLGFSNVRVISYGILVVGFIWLLSGFWLGSPFWIMPILIPITIGAEYVKIPYIDDNFTMLMIPLLVLKLIW